MIKMKGKWKKVYASLLINLTITFCLISIESVSSNEVDPFFTLISKCGGGFHADYLNKIKQHLKQIGINLDVIVLAWPELVADLLVYHDYDLLHYGFSLGETLGPEVSGIFAYNDNTMNLWGYDPTLDWDEDLGTGKNEWYIRLCNLILPPDSEERIQHFWEWQDYLMDQICPMLPTFSSRSYMALWSNLEGYNYSEGLQQSWGKMKWNGIHLGQANTSEIVIRDFEWTNLNPLFLQNSADSFISNNLMDSLVWYDPDLRAWPHLAKNYIHINSTHVRIEIREGIKWATDPAGNFTNEYLDVNDIYFTFYCWKYLSSDQHLFDWLEEMVIVDQYTIDLFVDGNPATSANEPFPEYLQYLTSNIMPEHFLNQTQIGDNITSDITHLSWELFATQAFGTGLFELKEYDEGNETMLSIRPNSWWLNESITNNTNLNWVERFGDFSGEINQLRIRIIPDLQTAQLEFEAGKVDRVGINGFPEKRAQYEADPNMGVQNDSDNKLVFVAYNMREERDFIGSREPCPHNNSISIGLAIRKAISYAINREEINEEIHSGWYLILNTPLPPKMGIWINPNITKYEYDYHLAKDYMYLAGFDLDYTPTIGFKGFTGLITIISFYTTILLLTKKKRRKHRI
ncbi:MAG: hypothetical protein FK732_07645 [Asgard group archaeon]|nr:hypothetical protein [Asgard group archaeon]